MKHIFGCESDKRILQMLAGGVAVLMMAGCSAAVAKAEPSEPIGPSESDSSPSLRMPDGRSVNSLTYSWPTNSYGHTFGPVTIADYRKGSVPDLIPVRADNGNVGYLRSDEIYLPTQEGRNGSLKPQRDKYNDDGEYVRDVYEADGRTKMGVATLATMTMRDGEGRKISPSTGQVVE